MPRVEWPLQNGRPFVQIILTLDADGQPLTRNLLADTGAGSAFDSYELVLLEDDCFLCGGAPLTPIILGGAYRGVFPRYAITVEVPQLHFVKPLTVVGIPTAPPGFDGIACFRFVNRFHYGNFGDSTKFGLES
jgi:hypothetical protein